MSLQKTSEKALSPILDFPLDSENWITLCGPGMCNRHFNLNR